MQNKNAYWHETLRLLGGCLLVWFVVSFGFGILLVDFLNQIRVGGFKLGFWFAQQGSIYSFLLIIVFYVRQMARIDKKYASGEEE
jgi:putative solute:sodium symporter small subunit